MKKGLSDVILFVWLSDSGDEAGLGGIEAVGESEITALESVFHLQKLWV
jgi:hypothetical protein